MTDKIKVVCVSDAHPAGGPTAVTFGKEYWAEPENGGYRIINDLGQSSWYDPERITVLQPITQEQFDALVVGDSVIIEDDNIAGLSTIRTYGKGIVLRRTDTIVTTDYPFILGGNVEGFRTFPDGSKEMDYKMTQWGAIGCYSSLHVLQKGEST